MNRRALIVFVILNITISVGVALLVIVLWQSTQETQEPVPQVQVFEVIITATPGPTQTPWIVTAIAPGGAIRTPEPGEPTIAPTLNPNILPDIATQAALTQVAIQSSGSEERTYTVQEGDNPALIADRLEVPLDDLLCANDLGTIDDPEFIYPGQALIIPGPDFICEPGAVATPAEEAGEPAATAASTPGAGPAESLAEAAAGTASAATPVPTVTLAPTAADAQVIIVQIVGAGDVTSEGVVIRNQGGLVDMEGWTLYDTQGTVFTFPDYRLFANAGVTVFSRVGENTAAALFWDETRPVWQPGDVATLADADGEVQSTFRVSDSER